LSIFYFNNHNN